MNLADSSGIFTLTGDEHADVLWGYLHPSCDLGLVYNPIDFLRPFRHLFAPVLGVKQQGECNKFTTPCQEKSSVIITRNEGLDLTTIGERLKYFLVARFGSVKAAAEAMEMIGPNLQQYFSGKSNPGNAVIQRLMRLGATGDDVEWILTGKRSAELDPKRMHGWAPFLGRIVASPDGKEYFDDAGVPKGSGVPFFNDNSFTLEIDGDSLLNAEPISIMPGDVCVFESGRQPKNGDIVAVHLVDDRRMVKILRHLSKDEVELKSANKYRNYPAIKLKKKQIASYGVFVTKLQLTDDAKQRFGLMKKGGRR